MDDQNHEGGPDEKNTAERGEQETHPALSSSLNAENADFVQELVLQNSRRDSLAHDTPAYSHGYNNHGQQQQQDIEAGEDNEGWESDDMIQRNELFDLNDASLDGDSHVFNDTRSLPQQEQNMELEEENEGLESDFMIQVNEMTDTNDASVHDDIHALSHDNSLPQQESYDGYMNTQQQDAIPYDMIHDQDVIEQLEDDDNTVVLVVSIISSPANLEL